MSYSANRMAGALSVGLILLGALALTIGFMWTTTIKQGKSGDYFAIRVIQHWEDSKTAQKSYLGLCNIFLREEIMSQTQRKYPTFWKETLKNTIKHHEGFRKDWYLDDVGVPTKGYGQTGKYADMPFDDVFDIFLDKAQKLTPNFNELPLEQQMAIISATYRGSWGGSPKARRLFAEGHYELASMEFLNSEEYRERKARGGDGVTKRMEWVAEILKETKNG